MNTNALTVIPAKAGIPIPNKSKLEEEKTSLKNYFPHRIHRACMLFPDSCIRRNDVML